MLQILIPMLVACCVCVCVVPAAAQNEQGETLAGPDSHETGQGPHGNLFGEWDGKRTRLLDDERITARIGQFAGQDFYGAQHYAASFIFEPMGYGLGNLFTDFESLDPPSTPAMEVRLVPFHDLYVKSMVEAEDREPFAHNATGLAPQFRGVPLSISEIGFSPGKNVSSVRAFDTVESRKGYSGLYQFGASYNPAKFTRPFSTQTQSGDYLLYWMASQALWRVDPNGAKGLDGTFAYDWSPANINRNNTMSSANRLPIRTV